MVVGVTVTVAVKLLHEMSTVAVLDSKVWTDVYRYGYTYIPLYA